MLYRFLFLYCPLCHFNMFSVSPRRIKRAISSKISRSSESEWFTDAWKNAYEFFNLVIVFQRFVHKSNCSLANLGCNLFTFFFGGKMVGGWIATSVWSSLTVTAIPGKCKFSKLAFVVFVLCCQLAIWKYGSNCD